jgi:glycosyltransferase involved in cell wall biosynthesis
MEQKEIPLGFSIILCTHNGEARLKPTLSHLAALEVPVGCAVELVVVNNASTDNTELVLKNVWQQNSNPFPLAILNEPRPGKGFATETGYDAARFSYILTVDDDNWLDPGYLTNALRLFESDPDVGILQGKSEGVFEIAPPAWMDGLKEFFIVGGPLKEAGYFPENNFYVWGAGMIIKNADWRYLRTLGFSALTSKLPGKAAGEDNELAIALMLLGRKAYYSEELTYKHYMPASRLTWEKLRQNFETHGYVNHYFFLYTLVVDAYKEGYTITTAKVRKKFISVALNHLRRNTFKQHLAYWMVPRQESYQLLIHLYYHQFLWFFRLRKQALRDIQFIQSWIMPLLVKRSKKMAWPLIDRT